MSSKGITGVFKAFFLFTVFCMVFHAPSVYAQVIYVEGINNNEPVDPSFSTDPGAESTFLYVPSQSYDLKRIEWFTNSGNGKFTVTFREDVGNKPATLLREVTFPLSGGSGFQGADFTTFYFVTAGTRYWVGFHSEQATGSHFALTGVTVEEWVDPDLDGDFDGGPFNWLRPMIKFYKPGAVADEDEDSDEGRD